MLRMNKYEGGTEVKSGFYWNLKSLEVATISSDGGALPGDRESRYVRLPGLALLVLAPLMGGLYVMFLPFIGIAMFLGFVGWKAGQVAEWTFMEAAVLFSPNWQPGVAYFAGRRRAGEESGAKDVKRAEPLEDVLREIRSLQGAREEGEAK